VGLRHQWGEARGEAPQTGIERELKQVDSHQRQIKRYCILAGALLVIGALASACSSPAAVPGASGSAPAVTGSPTQLLNDGVTALQAGKTSTAEADFKAVLSTDPSDKYLNNNIAFYDLGVIDQTEGNTKGAITEYKDALVLDANYPAAEYNLAIEETASDPTGAIALYRQVITANPSDVNAIYNLGLLLYETGQKSEGETYLSQAIQMAPSLAKKVPAGVTP
jgi:tetratricopeptide (TPR) repeat protein